MAFDLKLMFYGAGQTPLSLFCQHHQFELHARILYFMNCYLTDF
jgi:hypothetical protein